ncbi:pyridoxamine 5'-phosphate oxidase family protein [Actinocorallia sp. B10E7]|uniref:pyridoxamine 5'-phosphate oxidase family protein n=1 Tax=Actinocorallia sp. B10E7 TaxID=3153558 RepID=UPI00325C86E6
MTEPTSLAPAAQTTPAPGVTAIEALPPEVREVLERFIVCEYTSLTRTGRPITWPITPFVGAHGTLDLTTGLGYPDKAERARRDPRVALLYSDPTGSGLHRPPVVLVQGRAAVRDADLQANTDRFIRDLPTKTTGFAGTPWWVVRRWNWYFARIYIEVTPERVVWWPEGDLSHPPLAWTRPDGADFPTSDPAPSGPPVPGRAPAAAAPPDPRPFLDRAEQLGEPVVSAVVDGLPVTLRCRSAVRTPGGFELRLPAGAGPVTGPVCLTFHRHGPAMEWQENVVLVGTASESDGDGEGRLLRVEVERALNDWSLAGGGIRRSRAFLGRARTLRKKMREEAARRGQPVPVVRRPKPL